MNTPTSDARKLSPRELAIRRLRRAAEDAESHLTSVLASGAGIKGDVNARDELRAALDELQEVFP